MNIRNYIQRLRNVCSSPEKLPPVPTNLQYLLSGCYYWIKTGCAVNFLRMYLEDESANYSFFKRANWYPLISHFLPSSKNISEGVTTTRLFIFYRFRIVVWFWKNNQEKWVRHSASSFKDRVMVSDHLKKKGFISTCFLHHIETQYHIVYCSPYP